MTKCCLIYFSVRISTLPTYFTVRIPYLFIPFSQNPHPSVLLITLIITPPYSFQLESLSFFSLSISLFVYSLQLITQTWVCNTDAVAQTHTFLTHFTVGIPILIIQSESILISFRIPTFLTHFTERIPIFISVRLPILLTHSTVRILTLPIHFTSRLLSPVIY